MTANRKALREKDNVNYWGNPIKQIDDRIVAECPRCNAFHLLPPTLIKKLIEQGKKDGELKAYRKILEFLTNREKMPCYDLFDAYECPIDLFLGEMINEKGELKEVKSK